MSRSKLTLVFLTIPLILSLTLKIKFLTAAIITFGLVMLGWDLYLNVFKKKK